MLKMLSSLVGVVVSKKNPPAQDVEVATWIASRLQAGINNKDASYDAYSLGYASLKVSSSSASKCVTKAESRRSSLEHRASHGAGIETHRFSPINLNKEGEQITRQTRRVFMARTLFKRYGARMRPLSGCALLGFVLSLGPN